MATKYALYPSTVGVATDTVYTLESPVLGSSLAHSPSFVMKVKGTWNISTTDSIIDSHSIMNSVTPENKKRKQPQDSCTDEEGELLSFAHRKHTCSGSDHIKTEGCGSRTLNYLPRIDFHRDHDSCSSDSGTDEEAKQYKGESLGIVLFLYNE